MDSPLKPALIVGCSDTTTGSSSSSSSESSCQSSSAAIIKSSVSSSSSVCSSFSAESSSASKQSRLKKKCISSSDSSDSSVIPARVKRRRSERQAIQRISRKHLPLSHGMLELFEEDSSDNEDNSAQDSSLLTRVIVKRARRELEQIHDKPPVYLIYNFVSLKECQHILTLMDTYHLRQSYTDDSAIGNKIYSNERTSSFMFLNKTHDSVCRRIEERVSNILGVSQWQIEPFQCIRYTEGQQFTVHHDSGTLKSTTTLINSSITKNDDYNNNKNDDCCTISLINDRQRQIEKKKSNKKRKLRESQASDEQQQSVLKYSVDVCDPKRIASVFVYLNSLEAGMGGETVFPLLNDGKGLSIRPQRGCAVVWCNVKCNDTSQADVNVVHCAKPVIGKHTVKYGMNIWIDELPFGRLR